MLLTALYTRISEARLSSIQGYCLYVRLKHPILMNHHFLKYSTSLCRTNTQSHIDYQILVHV